MKPTKKFTSTFQGGKEFFKKLSSASSSSANLYQKKQEVKTAKRRKVSSTKWLQWHLNDQYVQKAKQDGYLSRAAYKIVEINQKHKIIDNNNIVIDLGAAPGGWTQVASKIVGNKGIVIAVDFLPVKAVAHNIKAITGDFLLPETLQQINSFLPCANTADVILSDMAPNTSGNVELDHIRIINLLELVLEFCPKALKPGGNLVVKLFQGGLQQELSTLMKQQFKKVTLYKPNASRKESKETYLIAKGYCFNSHNPTLT